MKKQDGIKRGHQAATLIVRKVIEIEYLLDEALKQIHKRHSIIVDSDFNKLVDDFRKENNINTNVYDLIRDKLKADGLIKWAGTTIDLTLAGIAFEGYVNQKNQWEGNLNKNGQIKNKSKEAKSYKWQSNPDAELPELYNKMKGVYIDPDTTLEQFTDVFTGQLTKSITLVKWIGSKNLLPYFIDVAFKLKKLTGITDKWAICKLCFNGVDNLSQSRDLYLNNKKGLPRNSHQIDELFKTL